MKERHDPQVLREARHVPLEGVGERVEVGASVVMDDTLRAAGGARGIRETDGIPLIFRLTKNEACVSLLDEIVVRQLPIACDR